MEIAADPPRYNMRTRTRLNFERALLEAAQDRALRAGEEGAVAPARRGGAYWWLMRHIAVPGFRALPWSMRRRLMRMAAGYPKGWPAPR